jgi:hypothetical protein
MGFVRVFSPETEPELLTVVAMLEAHDIPCFVQNAGFGGLYPGPPVSPYSMRAIMVPEWKVPAALELIRDFQAQPTEDSLSTEEESPLTDDSPPTED